MKKYLTLIGCICWIFMSLAQEESVEWSKDFTFTLADFQSPQTEINPDISTYLVQSGVIIELGFQMSNFSFMFKKNFNDKVICQLNKKAAVLVAVDTVSAKRLMKLAQFDFDLSELYARKIRKELYENKNTFSRADFFKPHYSKMMSERNKVSTQIYKTTEFGVNTELLEKEHQSVLQQIHVLADFCKTCKPPKKKKK